LMVRIAYQSDVTARRPLDDVVVQSPLSGAGCGMGWLFFIGLAPAIGPSLSATR
jgi:hypothetical protein